MKLSNFLHIWALLLCTPLVSNGIYDAVKEFPFDPSGYFATESFLDQIFRENQIKTVIELGSWAGASTRFFGYRVGDGGKVYAIDHWFGISEYRGEMTDSRLAQIFPLFLSNIRHAGLTERVVPIRMTTQEAAKFLNVKADLIYVDAARDFEGVFKDIIDWYPHLNENGVMCGTESREPEVKKGVLKAAHQLNKTVETDRKGLFWVLK